MMKVTHVMRFDLFYVTNMITWNCLPCKEPTSAPTITEVLTDVDSVQLTWAVSFATT